MNHHQLLDTLRMHKHDKTMIKTYNYTTIWYLLTPSQMTSQRIKIVPERRLFPDEAFQTNDLAVMVDLMDSKQVPGHGTRHGEFRGQLCMDQKRLVMVKQKKG